MGPPLEVLADARALAEEGARRTLGILRHAIAERGRATLALAGGSTPGALYQLLAADPSALDWDLVEFFWGDERCVPPDHESSNFAAASTTLLKPLGIPGARIHRMQGELWPPDGARHYEQQLDRVFQGPARFDLVLLGMGDDGHTASLFPGSPGLVEAYRPAISTLSPKAPPLRLTLTLPVLNGARDVLFLVAGASKQQALEQVRSQWEHPKLPAARVQPALGTLQWLVARSAASNES